MAQVVGQRERASYAVQRGESLERVGAREKDQARARVVVGLGVLAWVRRG